MLILNGDCFGPYVWQLPIFVSISRSSPAKKLAKKIEGCVFSFAFCPYGHISLHSVEHEPEEYVSYLEYSSFFDSKRRFSIPVPEPSSHPRKSYVSFIGLFMVTYIQILGLPTGQVLNAKVLLLRPTPKCKIFVSALFASYLLILWTR